MPEASSVMSSRSLVSACSRVALASVALIACDAGQPAAKTVDATAAKADGESKGAGKAEAAKADAGKADAKADAKPAAKPADGKGVLAHDRGPSERTPPKLDAEEAQSSAATFAAALKAGREAAQSKNYDEAILQFEAALKLDPNHPGALGELGWVAYRKGELERAHSVTMKAMSHAKSPRRKGSLLYNLGRIEEAQGRLEHALDLYHRSLSVRDNDIVAKRVVELEGKLAAADAPPPPPAYTSVDALCAEELIGLVLCPGEGDEGECGCTAEKTLTNPSADAVIKSAAIISVGSFISGMGLEEYGYLAIETKTRGWQLVSMVGDGSEPGLSYIHNAWTLKTFEFQEIEGGGAPELVVAVERMEADGDYASNAMEFSEYTDMWLCYPGDPAARCVMFSTSSESGLEKMVDDGEVPNEEDWGPLGTHKTTVEVSFAEGKVVLTDGGVPSEERAAHAGSFTLAELATQGWSELIVLH